MFHFYYVISAFPTISLGQKSDITYEEAIEMIAMNASNNEWKQVVLFQRIFDIQNIRALWLHEPLDPRGNFKEKGLEEALLVGESLPSFVISFLERYETLDDRIRYFPSLMASLYRETSPHLTGFLKKYYQLEREIRLSLTALRAKWSGKNLLKELQFEDPMDPFVAQLLAQMDEKEPILPEEYKDLKEAFLEHKNEPKKLLRSILQIRLSRIEEIESETPFSLDQVLGFLARLAIVESWNQLNEEKGRIALQEIAR